MSSMREKSGALCHYWYVACTQKELKSKPISRVIMDEHLVLYRGKNDGQVHCLLDRCLHRNAMLSEGFIQGDNIICPYHGWEYNGLGKCQKIPSLGPSGGALPNKQLAAFPVQEKYGLIWVYMGDPHNIQCEPFPIPYWQHDGWRSYYMVTEFDNNVTNCAENFMDVPHTIFVHSGWFRSETTKSITAVVERKDQSVLVDYKTDDDAIGYSHLLLNPKKEPMTHTDKFYMPNVTRVDYNFGSRNGFIITSQCTPVHTYKTMVYTAITYRLGWLNKLARIFLPPYTRKVIQQDVEIMANQKHSLARYPAEFMNSPADVIHKYIESYRDWAMAGKVGPPPKDAKSEVVFYV